MTIDWSKLEIWKLSEEEIESLAECQENPIDSWYALTHALGYAVSVGKLDEIHQSNKWVRNGEQWVAKLLGPIKELPTRLFHITTAASHIEENKFWLESRGSEKTAPLSLGSGDGGGYVSLTDNWKSGLDIYRAYQELWLLLTCRLSITDLLEIARTGKGAQQPWNEFLDHYYENYWEHTTANEEYESLKRKWTGIQQWLQRKNDIDDDILYPTDHVGTISHFYKMWSQGRERSEGHEYPNIWGNPRMEFLKMNHHEIAITEYRPVKNAYGYFTNKEGLNEWRVFDGRGLIYVQTHHPILEDLPTTNF